MSARRTVAAHVVWMALVAGTVTAILVAVASRANPDPQNQCEGIGWGCQLYGADLAGFVAIFLVPAALVLLTIGHVLIALRNRRR